MILRGGGGLAVCCLPVLTYKKGKKGKDHFDTFNAHFIFAQFLIILHLSSSIFDWEVRLAFLPLRNRFSVGSIKDGSQSRSIGKYVERVKTRNDNGLRIWIFSQKLPFSVEKKMFRTQI